MALSPVKYFFISRAIHKKEVYPVLKHNLNSPVGNWTGLDKTWLIKKIQNSLRKKHFFSSLGYKKINQEKMEGD